jgi:membrane fusion protein, multidrug efflux system
MNKPNKIFIVAVALLSLTMSACNRQDAQAQGPNGAMPPPPVSVAPVIEREIVESESFSGRLEAVESVEVRARITGYIDSVQFKQGELVRKGDVLVQIDPRPFQANLASAEANLAAARARAELAKTELTRTDQLVRDNAASRQELDQRNSALRDGEAAVRAAQAQVDRAKLDLGFTRVTAPISGRVGRVEITAGNLIQGDVPNSPLLTTIVTTSPIYAAFEIDEPVYLKYGLNKPGARLPVGVGLANEEGFPHKATLVFVDNQVDTTSGTVRARALVENKSGALTPGLYARVRLSDQARARKAVLINDRAVGTDQSKKFVLVIGPDNKANYREVRLGRIVDGLRIVEEGLKPGELIVVNGIQRVRPGSPVTPQPANMDGSPAAAPAANAPKKIESTKA